MLGPLGAALAVFVCAAIAILALRSASDVIAGVGETAPERVPFLGGPRTYMPGAGSMPAAT